MELPFEEYWGDIRDCRRTIPLPKESPTELTPLVLWAQNLWDSSRQAFHLLPGSDHDRGLAIERIKQELSGGELVQDSLWLGWPRAHLLHVIRDLTVPYRDHFTFTPPQPERNPVGWDLLWCLVARRNLVVSDSLRNLVSRKGTRFADFYRSLVEIRFETAEHSSLPTIEEGVLALGHWIEGSVKDSGVQTLMSKSIVRNRVRKREQVDLLLFLLTLAKANGLLDELVVYFDLKWLDRTGAEELYKILGDLEHWIGLGCPLSLLLGWEGDRQAVRGLHPRLSSRFREGLAWMDNKALE
jgi:hypothetical protein